MTHPSPPVPRICDRNHEGPRRSLASQRHRVIAGFACAQDAQEYADAKRARGENAQVRPGHPDSAFLFEVHTLPRSL